MLLLCYAIPCTCLGPHCQGAFEEELKELEASHAQLGLGFRVEGLGSRV